MNTLSNKEVAIMGLLSEKPRHAYQIEKSIEMRSMREWTEISMSSVYKLLPSLEKRGLVSSTTKLSNKNISQKIYTLTAPGKKALKSAVKHLISEPENMVWRLDVAVNNLHLLSREEIEECFAVYQQKLDELVKGYDALKGYLREHDCPTYRMGLASRPQEMFRAHRKWVQEYVKSLDA